LLDYISLRYLSVRSKHDGDTCKIHVRLPLPPGNNPIAVNKYYYYTLPKNAEFSLRNSKLVFDVETLQMC